MPNYNRIKNTSTLKQLITAGKHLQYTSDKLSLKDSIKLDDGTVIAQDINGDESQGKAAIEDVFLDKESIDEFCLKSNILVGCIVLYLRQEIKTRKECSI